MSTKEYSYFVYILMNSRRTVLYIGVTNDISRRSIEHTQKMNPKSFFARYNCTELVYVEQYDNVYIARERELYLKGWRRSRKIELIQSHNPTLKNLFR